MLLMVEIGLAFWAWKRGWKWWILIPFSFLLVAEFVLVLSGAISLNNLWVSIFLDLALIATMSIMVFKKGPFAKPQLAGYAYNSSTPVNIKSSTKPVDVPVYPQNYRDASIQDSIQPFGSDKAIVDRPSEPGPVIEMQPKTQIFRTARAKLVLPDNTEIPLIDSVKLMGRCDFDGIISSEALRYISRNHFLIGSDKAKYFIEDLNSANGTKTNGAEIRGVRKELNDGDIIEIVDSVKLTFRT